MQALLEVEQRQREERQQRAARPAPPQDEEEGMRFPGRGPGEGHVSFTVFPLSRPGLDRNDSGGSRSVHQAPGRSRPPLLLPL